VLLLSESLNALELAGGAAIAAGIVIERRGERSPEQVVVLGE
jgi:drug/metabolite transporter (DMT)-like permease